MSQDKLFKTTTNSKMVFEIFPQEFLDLDMELKSGYHPKIAAIVAGYPADEIDIKLAQIAAYCEVILDGEYDIQDRTKVAGILVKRLKERREDPNAQVIILT